MKKVAVLGLGAMGSRIAAAIGQAGFELIVWNRDRAKADAFSSRGAAVAGSPRAAALAADVVIAIVRDDQASARVWLDPQTGALPALRPGAIGIESSTVSVAHTSRLAAAARESGVGFLDAPVVGSRAQADARQLIYLVGGDAVTLSRAEPLLQAASSAIHHAGHAGSGAALKLAINALFATQVAAVAEIVATLARLGVDQARALDIVGATPVASPAMKAIAASMLAGAYAPQFPIALAEKDLSYMRAAAQGEGSQLPVTDAVLEVFRAARSRGLGEENLTAVRKLY